MASRTGKRSRFAAVAIMIALVVVMDTAHAADHGEVGGGGTPDPVGPLAAEMNRALELNPGGVQLSDTTMSWHDGTVVVVWPSPGETRASSDQPDRSVKGSPTTCPAGYYCFYTGSSYDGARYQFSSTCSGSPAGWNFDNQTTSWVNRSTQTIRAYDYSGGPLLWTMSPGQASPQVGLNADNRMGYWSC